MPRVLQIVNRLNLGGITPNAAYLTKYLEPEFETILLAGQKDDSEASSEFIVKDLGIKPHYIRSMYRSLNPFKDISAYYEIKQLIKEFKPDIVHTHAAKSGALGRLAAINTGVPIIIHTFHGHVFHSYFGRFKTQFFLQIERFLAKKTTKIIAISDIQRYELAEVFKVAPLSKFVVIPLGFDLKLFQENQEEKRRNFRKEFDIGNDTVCIGIVGRLVPIKNHSLFLRAIKYLSENTTQKFCAFIVGDGESRLEIEQLAIKLGLSFATPQSISENKAMPQLIFTSWRRDIDCVNAGMDIIALTSDNEGTPVSLIEAQAANKAIVSTQVGGVNDIVLAGKTALLSKKGDDITFYANLLQLVENTFLRNQLGKDGFLHVMSTFSYQRLINDMTVLYEKLLYENKIKY